MPRNLTISTKKSEQEKLSPNSALKKQQAENRAKLTKRLKMKRNAYLKSKLIEKPVLLIQRERIEQAEKEKKRQETLESISGVVKLKS